MIDKINSIRDLAIFLGCAFITWLILSDIDAFELMVEYLESHEEYELDELVLLLMVLGAYSVVYTFFRAKEARRINKQLKSFNNELERKIEEEVLKNKEKEILLLEQSKLASMGEMIGNIAHQWRQPLNALSLVIQNIQVSYYTDDLTDESLDKSVKKANTLTSEMSKTIDDFRFFYNPNKERRKFGLSESIDKSLNLIDASFNHNNIEIVILKNEEVYVLGFSNEFSQVILNLLTNAKDALLEREISEPEVKIEIYKDENYGYVKVADNAKGIIIDNLDKIFEPYFTTKEEGKGTGIGLYMSKAIIEQNMDGKLKVQNTKDGAEFIIKLPLFKEAH